MAYKKPEDTFEVRAFVPKINNKDIKHWMIDNDQTDKNIACGLIIEEYFELLKEVETHKGNDDWISIKDALPNHYQRVIVGRETEAGVMAIVTYEDTNDKHWGSVSNWFAEPTHWMPLPKQPNT